MATRIALFITTLITAALTALGAATSGTALVTHGAEGISHHHTQLAAGNSAGRWGSTRTAQTTAHVLAAGGGGGGWT